MMLNSESPIPPRSPSFYRFRSHSSIPPPQPHHETDSLVTDVIPHLVKQSIRSVTAIILPIFLLPFHFFFLVLSIITTLLAGAFLSWTAFMVYVDIAMDSLGQVYADYIVGGKRRGRRRRDLLRKVVLEREEAVKAYTERPRARGRGSTIA
jgi:ABC-type methionine transport system permease subunit